MLYFTCVNFIITIVINTIQLFLFMIYFSSFGDDKMYQIDSFEKKFK